VLFDKLETAEMHGLYTSNVSSRDEPSGIWAQMLSILRYYVMYYAIIAFAPPK